MLLQVFFVFFYTLIAATGEAPLLKAILLELSSFFFTFPSVNQLLSTTCTTTTTTIYVDFFQVKNQFLSKILKQQVFFHCLHSITFFTQILMRSKVNMLEYAHFTALWLLFQVLKFLIDFSSYCWGVLLALIMNAISMKLSWLLKTRSSNDLSLVVGNLLYSMSELIVCVTKSLYFTVFMHQFHM